MSTATIKLYNILVDKGVDKAVAEDALGEFLTREEAENTLATKQDLEKNTRWLITTFIGIAFGQIAIMTGIMALLLDVFVKSGAV